MFIEWLELRRVTFVRLILLEVEVSVVLFQQHSMVVLGSGLSSPLEPKRCWTLAIFFLLIVLGISEQYFCVFKWWWRGVDSEITPSVYNEYSTLMISKVFSRISVDVQALFLFIYLLFLSLPIVWLEPIDTLVLFNIYIQNGQACMKQFLYWQWPVGPTWFMQYLFIYFGWGWGVLGFGNWRCLYGLLAKTGAISSLIKGYSNLGNFQPLRKCVFRVLCMINMTVHIGWFSVNLGCVPFFLIFGVGCIFVVIVSGVEGLFLGGFRLSSKAWLLIWQ